jgi:GT2 family glycosyltransferase
MSKKKQKTRKRAPSKQATVLIVKPHNIEYQTDERCSQWIMKAFQRGIGEVYNPPTKLPEVGRNTAIKKFLTDPEHAKKTHIFFIDADTVPMNDYAIETLLRHNKAVVAGVTPIVRKAEELRCMWSVVLDDPDEPDNMSVLGIDELPKKLFKAKRVGGTTLLIRRDVLEKLTPPYQKSTFNEDITQQIESEDYFFSDKIRKAGYTIFVDPDVICHHYHITDHLDIFAAYRAGIEEGKKRRLGM